MVLGNSQAYTVKYIPTNIEEQVAGLNSSLSPHNTGGVFSYKYGIELVKDNIIDLLTTRRGDRVMLPDFGTTIHLAPFELLDSYLKDDIKNDILRTISFYEPRVDVVSCEVLESDELEEFEYQLYGGSARGGMREHQLIVRLIISLKGDAASSSSIVLAY
tara:strand:+ start:273 stop:752 length:480 start_codon:yes stop_codon:yes gene_type:complete